MKSWASEPGLTNHLYAQQLDYLNLIAVRKYHFLDSFLFCVVYKVFAVTILKYHSLNWKDVSVTNADIFEKKYFSLQFFFSLLRVYNVANFLCWPPGRGIWFLVCTRRFPFHEFYKFLLFSFLIGSWVRSSPGDRKIFLSFLVCEF